jgi:multicomponent Na+:H+ antiporter subunit D
VISLITDNLPALQVAVPLIGAPICALMVRGYLAWIFATIVSWLTFAISIALMSEVLHAGSVTYLMGGWAAPWGIEYHIDALSALLLVLVAGMAAIIMPAARLAIGVEVTDRARRLFYTVALLALTGMLGIVATGDAFNLYVFLEISSLASYALIAMGNTRRATTAAFHYLILGTIGATFILIGIGLIYSVTGTLNMADRHSPSSSSARRSSSRCSRCISGCPTPIPTRRPWSRRSSARPRRRSAPIS